MTLLDAIQDFIEFYLSPWQSPKTVEFVQLKVHHKIENSKSHATPDELLKTVSAFTEALKLIHRYRKSQFSYRIQKPDPSQQLHLDLIHLPPSDALILLSRDRYSLPDSTLSIILKKSETSVQFRRNKLTLALQEDGHTEINFAKLNPRLLALHDQSPIFRPQRSIFQRFQSLPFALRFLIETCGVIAILIVLMWIIPEIRNTYENSVQKRINDYLIEASLLDAPAPEGTSKTPKAIIPTPDQPNAASNETKEQEQPIEEPATTKKLPKVNEGETWRFSFTGSQTSDLQSGIETIFKKQNIDQAHPLTVPGGIQFDFTLPTSSLINLKSALEDMTLELQRKSGTTKQSGISAANMSWYKKKNMGTRKIPSGQVQVIIWVSTL